MPPDPLPDDVRRLLDERAAAREERDFARADALRDRVEALGWEVQDAGGRSTARPILVREAEADPIEEAATIDASVQLAAEDHPADLARFLRGLAAYPPATSWELVIVANAPVEPVAETLGSVTLPVEPVVLDSSERLGWADARTLGMRHSHGEVTILLDTSLEPTGDFVTPLLAAFDDPSVGIAGGWGVTSGDARQFHEAPPGPVDAIEAYCLAIRRDVVRAVGGFDRRFRFYRNADLDLSFAVRDAGWTALRTEPLPLARHEHRGWTSVAEHERDRLSKRNFYRFLDRWGARRDLLLHPDTDR
jgi:GT2 family glycosyltransferase